jgi:2,4-dienoyl-CoA reductase-like NADH-dependent reductase (Old Yellow Enzyme family)
MLALDVMWHPPNATRHALLDTRWPSQEEADGSLLFTPLRHGRFAIRTRTWVPAMVPWRATESGEVTQDVLGWYERFAQGKPGGLVLEATGIRDVASGPLLRLGDDRFIEGMRQVARRVHTASEGETLVLVQLIDFLKIRRRPPAAKYFERFLEITERHRSALGIRAEAEVRSVLAALPEEKLRSVLTPSELEALQYGYRERVTDTHLEEIRELPRRLPGLFAAAARRAEAAGMHGVELHYAHAYTMASLLSATNTRSDGYGGPLTQRLRLPLEVLAAVRAAVSERFVVGVRYLADECIPGGNGVDEAKTIALALAKAGVDFISLSRGGKFDDAKQPKVGDAAYPYTGPSGWECMPTTLADEAGPFGRNLHSAAKIRAHLRGAGCETPVVVAGGIATFDQAEAILQTEQADVVASARQSLADPDWFLKMRRGRGREIRRCVFTNYCEGLDQKHKAVTCKLWDRHELQAPGVRLDPKGRRRLIAPAWPLHPPGASERPRTEKS